MTWKESDIRISREAAPGEFTLYHWNNVPLGISAKAFFIEPFVHTLITGLVAAVVAVLLGGMLSWLITRTDLPGRRWLRPVLTIPYIIPSFALALAWETLFRSPMVGGQPGLSRLLLAFLHLLGFPTDRSQSSLLWLYIFTPLHSFWCLVP